MRKDKAMPLLPVNGCWFSQTRAGLLETLFSAQFSCGTEGQKLGETSWEFLKKCE
jgi:hypothetical protein